MCDYSIDSGTVKQPWLRDILVVKRVAWDGSGHAHHIYIITNFEDKDRTAAAVKQWWFVLKKSKPNLKRVLGNVLKIKGNRCDTDHSQEYHEQPTYRLESLYVLLYTYKRTYRLTYVYRLTIHREYMQLTNYIYFSKSKFLDTILNIYFKRSHSIFTIASIYVKMSNCISTALNTYLNNNNYIIPTLYIYFNKNNFVFAILRDLLRLVEPLWNSLAGCQHGSPTHPNSRLSILHFWVSIFI